jgi:hypothetical protein
MIFALVIGIVNERLHRHFAEEPPAPLMWPRPIVFAAPSHQARPKLPLTRSLSHCFTTNSTTTMTMNMDKMEHRMESMKSKPNDEKESKERENRSHDHDSRGKTKFVNGDHQCPRIASLLENAMTGVYYRQIAANRRNSFDFANRIERLGLLDIREACALAARLRGCRPHRRCYSLACDLCRNAEPPLITSIVKPFVGDREHESSIAFVVPPNSSVQKGSLHEFSETA